MMKTRHRRHFSMQDNQGPGILLVVIALLAVAMVTARFLGLSPASLLTSADRFLSGSGQNQLSSIDVTQRDEPAATGQRTEPRVLIYHAHASENYAPQPTHAPAGRPGDIVEVGRELAAALEAKGIRTIHLTGVYDNPWREAYAAAGRAVADVLQANPSIEMVIDVHRDAVESRTTGVATTHVGSVTAAKVLFTVGELNNPHVQANATLATQLKQALDSRYPGVARGVRMYKQETNGHLHPNAVELHIGDYYDSTLEEAKVTARYLADVIAAVLN